MGQDSQLYEALCGKLLGDGTISVKSRLQFRHTKKDAGYVYDQLQLFARYLPFGPNEPLTYAYRDQRTDKTYTTLICQTHQDKRLATVRDLWYPNKTKVIPYHFVEKYLTPLALAIWYQDDGALKNERRIILSTECFTDEDLTFLQRLLAQKYGIVAHIDSQRRLDICKRQEVELFLSYVQPYMSDSMQRKSLTSFHHTLLAEATDIQRNRSLLEEEWV